ncbi:TPA: hypothetical protein RU568_004137 [Salmonella enterica]|nr:hypothetical protein [Salmonella enterica]
MHHILMSMPRLTTRQTQACDHNTDLRRCETKATELIEKLTAGRLTLTKRPRVDTTLNQVIAEIKTLAQTTGINYRTDVFQGEEKTGALQKRTTLDYVTVNMEDGDQLQITKNAGRYYVQSGTDRTWRPCTAKERAAIEKLEDTTGTWIEDYTELTTDTQQTLASKYGSRVGVNFVGERLGNGGPGIAEFDTITRMGVQDACDTPALERTPLARSAGGDWWPRCLTNGVTINGVPVPTEIMQAIGEMTSVPGKNTYGTIEPSAVTTPVNRETLEMALNEYCENKTDARKLLRALTSPRTIAVLAHLNDQSNMAHGERSIANALYYSSKRKIREEATAFLQREAKQQVIENYTKLDYYPSDRSHMKNMIQISYEKVGDTEQVTGQRDSISALSMTRDGNNNAAVARDKVAVVKQTARISTIADLTYNTWEELQTQVVDKHMWGTSIVVENDEADEYVV